jgi:hypothetical protein
MSNWGGGFITIINYASTYEAEVNHPSNIFLELAGPPILLLDGTDFELLALPA